MESLCLCHHIPSAHGVMRSICSGTREQKEEKEKWLAHSGFINHWKGETLPGEVGDSTWHCPDAEPECHKSPWLYPQQTCLLSQCKDEGYFAGSGAGVYQPMDTSPFCVFSLECDGG